MTNDRRCDSFSRRMAGRLILVAAVAGAAHAEQPAASRRSAHGFSFEGLEGGESRLGDLAGRAILVVNTASRCGFAPQFRDLQALFDRYRERGLTVIGVPSNDFGGQEPGSAAEIKAFCTGDYGVTFPMAAKQAVIGPDAHPFYRWAARERASAVPRWNFHKILVDRQGALAATFDSPVRPSDLRVVAAIQSALDAPA